MTIPGSLGLGFLNVGLSMLFLQQNKKSRLQKGMLVPLRKPVIGGEQWEVIVIRLLAKLCNIQHTPYVSYELLDKC